MGVSFNIMAVCAIFDPIIPAAPTMTSFSFVKNSICCAINLVFLPWRLQIYENSLYLSRYNPFMALFLTKDLDDPGRSRLGVWKITESEEELRNMSSVPTDELEEISYIKNESLRKQKLAVRALLDAMFDDKVYLSHHDNGKPYIENCATSISITHTEKYVAVILSETEDVGIDIESLDRDFSAVEKKALSEDEIDDLDDDKRNEQLAIYWCAKEAIFKMQSQNDVNFAEQIEIERFRPKSDGELEATFIDKDGFEEDFDLEYMTFDGHILVWTAVS